MPARYGDLTYGSETYGGGQQKRIVLGGGRVVIPMISVGGNVKVQRIEAGIKKDPNA